MVAQGRQRARRAPEVGAPGREEGPGRDLNAENKAAAAFKLIESAQAHWRAVNAPHLVALVRAGAKFENGKLVERPDESGGDQQAA